MITLEAYWMGRDVTHADELTDEIRNNAEDTVAKANQMLELFQRATSNNEPRTVTSGWRPAAINAATPNAAPRSHHMTGNAIDISDPEGDLDEWLFTHLFVLEQCGLWLEHPSCTARGWSHVQRVPPKSGKRVFFP